MNFEVESIRIFRIDDADYKLRIYSVIQKTNGLLKFTNVLNGVVFLDNINPLIITINNEPMANLKELQEVVFNPKCVCTEDDDGAEFKIFDLTFDKTFE